MFNTLPDDLRDPAVSTLTFTVVKDFSLPIRTFSALGVSHVMRSINVRYLLTYLLIPPYGQLPRDYPVLSLPITSDGHNPL